MKIGMTVEPFEGISASNLIPLAKAIALEHIEINVNSMSDVDKIIENLGKLTTTFHMPIHFVDGYEPGTSNPERKKQIKKVISFINSNHQELNMLYTLAHPPEAEEATFDNLIESLQQIETPIILENIPPGWYWITETVPPPGYGLAPPQYIEVTASSEVELTFIDYPLGCSLTWGYWKTHTGKDSGGALTFFNAIEVALKRMPAGSQDKCPPFDRIAQSEFVGDK